MCDVSLRVVRLCGRCCSHNIGNDRNEGEVVCYDCGLVIRKTYQYEITNMDMFTIKTYKRIFYFNERCKRWLCTEPRIEPDIIFLLEDEYHAHKHKYVPLCKEKISRLLRSVELPMYYQRKFQSLKFNKNLLTKKRFHDKYYEKWKTIIAFLTGIPPIIPSTAMVDCMKRVFRATQLPFEYHRHDPRCDGRRNCENYFSCWHNYMNYDWLMRKLLRVTQDHYRFDNAYEIFKNDFTLINKAIRVDKLHPIWKKICDHNSWTYRGYLDD